ncbi:hypothetical protein FHETE_10332 [Fusarium heterosporum]|uniref:Uncharacterized protein n=1 Tax=Fusarium heterosporum TaxID=42747 RepID=A0A8H5SV57_FUSHE|nr:hypothetical protein FHETE_10332 [Fusarium heterosporum]
MDVLLPASSLISLYQPEKSQFRLMIALWNLKACNHVSWNQDDVLTEQLWCSMKLSDGADVEVDCDVRSTDGEDNREDVANSEDQSSVMRANDPETEDMDDGDEEKDHNRNED